MFTKFCCEDKTSHLRQIKKSKQVPVTLQSHKNMQSREYGLSMYTSNKKQTEGRPIKKIQSQKNIKGLHRSKSGMSLSHQKAMLIQKLYEVNDFNKNSQLNQQDCNTNSNKNLRSISSSSKNTRQVIVTKASSPSLTNYSNKMDSVFDFKQLKRQIQKEQVINQYYAVFDTKKQTQMKYHTKQHNYQDQNYKIQVPFRKTNLKLTLKDVIK